MKIKRKALSILSCLALLLSSIPSTAVFVSASGIADSLTYLQKSDFGQDSTTAPILFADGHSITVTADPGNPAQNIVTCDEDDSTRTIPKNASIFAGSHNDDKEVGPVTITIDGAEINNVVWGGGMHKSHVTNATIVVKSGSKVKVVQGGGAATNSAIKTPCADGCDGAIKDSDGTKSTCVVDDATITIEDGATVTSVFGGGEGYSKTTKTTVNIKGGDIGFVGAGGSNGYTGTANVKIEGGNIGLVQSVNRGTMDSAEIDVSGGTVDKLYIGGETEDAKVNGTITNSTVKVTGGKVKKLSPGKTNNKVIDQDSGGTFNVEMSKEATVDLDTESNFKGITIDCTHKLPLIKVSEAKEATCTENGAIDVWQCSNCNKYFTKNDASEELVDKNDDGIVNEEDFKTDMIAHKYDEHTLTKCDGSESDYKYYSCSSCGKFFEDDTSGKEIEVNELKAKIDAATNHKTEVVKGKAATCSEVGYTDGLHCTECGLTIIAQQMLNRDGSKHEKDGKSTWPETWSKLTSEDIEETGYNNVDDCTKGGWQVRKCTECGAKQYKYVEPADEHTWGDPVIDADDDKEATCTEVGKKTKICSVCGVKESVEIPAKAHKLPDGETAITMVKAVEPTCTTEGNDRYWKCSLCQACFSDKDGNTTIDESTKHKDALGHDYEEVKAVPPTCTESGVSEYKQCKRCGTYEEGHEKRTLPVVPNAHVYTDLLGEAKVATCTETGLYAYFQCTACKKYYKITATDESGNNTYEELTLQEGAVNPKDLEIPLAPHKYSEDKTAYKAPDCTNKGNYGSVECTVCNAKFKTTDDKGVDLEENAYVKVENDNELQIDALGHAWEKHAETCTKVEYYQCTREDCGKLATVLPTVDGADETYTPSEGTNVYLKYVASEADLNKPEATHTWGTPEGENKDATCTEAGTIKHVKCQNCDTWAQVSDEDVKTEWTTDTNDDGTIDANDFVIKAKGHTWDEAGIQPGSAPSCTETGLTSYTTCSVCGAYAEVTGEAGSYNYTEWTVEANDKNADSKIDATDFVIPASGHNNGEGLKCHEAVDATCTEPGSNVYYYCDVCGKCYAEQGDDGFGTGEALESSFSISAKGHTPEQVKGYEATCSKEGLTDGEKCKECGVYLVPQQVIAKTAHTLVNITDAKAPTCTEAGYEGGQKCSVCNQVVVAPTVKPALNHEFLEENYKTTETDKAATCTDNATQTAKCTRCDATDTREVPETALGHNYVAVEAKDATCTEDGIKEGYFKCSRCETYFKSETVAEGDETKTVYTEVPAEELVIPAKGHKVVVDDAVESTCTSAGLTEGKHCEVCEEVIVPQLPIPMKPHTSTPDDAVAPTCTKSGLTAGSHCSVCGGILVVQVVIPALGHDYDKNGVCTRCGEKLPSYSNSEPNTDKPVKVIKITQAKLTSLKVKSKAKNTINVSWKKVKNAKGYEIEVSKNSNFKAKAKVLTKTTKKLKLKIKNKKKLKSKKTYYVRVRAYTTYKAADGSTQKACSNWNYVLRKVKVK